MATVHNRIAGRVSTYLSVVALLLGTGVGPPALAQNPDDTRSPGHSAQCLPRASRAKEHCDPITVVVRAESEFQVPLGVPLLKPVYCAPVIAIEYTQRDTAVDIAGTISNADCAACSGEYEVLVNVRDESNGLQILRFVETWRRQYDLPVAFKARYPIPKNVDIVGVRARSVRCTCLTPKAE